MQLETKIANAHWSRQQSGDVSKGNNHWTRQDFATKAPGLDWTTYFASAGLGSAKTFVVWQPSAFTGLSALTASEPIDAWKAWLAFHTIRSHAGALPSAFVATNFGFYGTVLNGTTKMRDRWKRAVGGTNGAVGFAVGKLYTQKYFSAADKAKVQALVANELNAFATRIDHLDWMAPATKAEAKPSSRSFGLAWAIPTSGRITPR